MEKVAVLKTINEPSSNSKHHSTSLPQILKNVKKLCSPVVHINNVGGTWI
jgi:hypothetical protein